MAANVLLFVPFGLALTLRAWRVPLWRVAMVSAAFSVGIELTQGWPATVARRTSRTCS